MPSTSTAKNTAAKSKPKAKYGRISAYDFQKLDKDEAEAIARAKAEEAEAIGRAEAEEAEEERAGANPPTPPPAKKKMKMLPKPLPKGEKAAEFQGESNWCECTQKILEPRPERSFSGPNLCCKSMSYHLKSISYLTNIYNDQSSHLNDIASLDSRIATKITDLTFQYANVSYNAHNDAQALTDAAVVNFASACPTLKKVELKTTWHLTDASLVAFFESCPTLTYLEITAASRYSLYLTGKAFTTLQSDAGLVLGLKKLRVHHSSKRGFMKAMRELTKERKMLTFELVSDTEEK
ncbi:hypothetical protein K458DRAFT_483760 [Lentithecium fluviatile CBS 122367]|uniref:RNI-like protein n=1 Tax=Lentithecium fluviatile CBS 122367 TaxID=1168545 RepID=A0A6G1JIZ1_9PLEO|nr:hypothetical protein K458DRAFT_483760 [Lentithecium fluviatile CBS 122367]